VNLSGKTVIYGLIADPIEHTLSPLMQNSAIAEMGIDAVYVPFNVKPYDLEHAVRGMTALNVRGLNVTVPQKTAIMKYMDRLTDDSEAVGAVNTIINNDGVLTGDNTDVYGITMCLTKDGGLARLPERVYVLGAGGAARGVIYACAVREEVKEISVINRTFSKAEKIAVEISRITGKVISPLPAVEGVFREVLPSASLVINTTSLGLKPHINETPVPDTDVFHGGQVVCDIIYNPVKTRFLSDAESRGSKTINGLSMLAYQGARSLSLWTGMDAPAEVMMKVLRKVYK